MLFRSNNITDFFYYFFENFPLIRFSATGGATPQHNNYLEWIQYISFYTRTVLEVTIYSPQEDFISINFDRYNINFYDYVTEMKF